MFSFSDTDSGVCLYSYWSLELVNRPRHTESKYLSRKSDSKRNQRYIYISLVLNSMANRDKWYH